MAGLLVEGDELVLHLSRAEKLEAVHGDLRAPRPAVRSVQVLEDAHEPAGHGLKEGERLPGHSEVAVVRTGGQWRSSTRSCCPCARTAWWPSRSLSSG